MRGPMSNISKVSIPRVVIGCALVSRMFLVPAAASDYHAILPDGDGKIVTLSGHDLTIEDVVAVARHGAQVRYSPEAIQRATDGNDLRAEAGAENIPVYGLNRGAGALREVQVKRDEFTQLSAARAGAKEGVLPEIADEDL